MYRNGPICVEKEAQSIENILCLLIIDDTNPISCASKQTFEPTSDNNKQNITEKFPEISSFIIHSCTGRAGRQAGRRSDMQKRVKPTVVRHFHTCPRSIIPIP